MSNRDGVGVMDLYPIRDESSEDLDIASIRSRAHPMIPHVIVLNLVSLYSKSTTATVFWPTPLRASARLAVLCDEMRGLGYF